MARRGIPKGQVNWYLREWMEACDLKGRGAQTKMMELTGWSKATMSQLFNSEQDYSPKIVNEAAAALKAEPWELLMHPERAMRLRRLRAELVGLAHEEEDVPPLDHIMTKIAERDDDAPGTEERGTGTHG